MTHELLGIHNNRVNLANAPGVKIEGKEIVLSVQHDDFYAKVCLDLQQSMLPIIPCKRLHRRRINIYIKYYIYNYNYRIYNTIEYLSKLWRNCK